MVKDVHEITGKVSYTALAAHEESEPGAAIREDKLRRYIDSLERAIFEIEKGLSQSEEVGIDRYVDKETGDFVNKVIENRPDLE